MKRVLFFVSSALVLVGSLASSAPALADDISPADGAGGGVVYKSTTKYDFDDDVVEGDLVRPDGEFVDTRKKAKHSSLIKIREDFIDEMLKSAEDL